MDNASKALLMAGGVLIALLVITLAVFVFNQMSDYQKSQSDLVEVEQLADFNEQFTQYVRNDLNGIDLVTLANKVVNFNQKDSGAGEINYDQNITLIINMENYQQKYVGNLFDKSTYTVENKNSDFFTYSITINKKKRFAIALLSNGSVGLPIGRAAATSGRGVCGLLRRRARQSRCRWRHRLCRGRS